LAIDKTTEKSQEKINTKDYSVICAARVYKVFSHPLQSAHGKGLSLSLSYVVDDSRGQTI
jgi:hypothetical protein